MRLAHIVLTVVPYVLLLATFTAAYHLRAAEIRADPPDQDPVAQRLQVQSHSHLLVPLHVELASRH